MKKKTDSKLSAAIVLANIKIGENMYRTPIMFILQETQPKLIKVSILLT